MLLEVIGIDLASTDVMSELISSGVWLGISLSFWLDMKKWCFMIEL